MSRAFALFCFFVLLLESFELRILIKGIDEFSKPTETWPQPKWIQVFAGGRGGLNISCFYD